MIHPTRFNGIGYRHDGVALWRFVDISTECSIGPYYATKAELLADIERYATVFGARFCGMCQTHNCICGV